MPGGARATFERAPHPEALETKREQQQGQDSIAFLLDRYRPNFTRKTSDEDARKPAQIVPLFAPLPAANTLAGFALSLTVLVVILFASDVGVVEDVADFEKGADLLDEGIWTSCQWMFRLTTL